MEIYRNTPMEFVYPPGAGVWVADDVRTICDGAILTELTIGVSGGGDGTGLGFSVEVVLYDSCPHDGGVPIDGTQREALLLDDGDWIVTFEFSEMPIQLPGGFWVATRFSTDEAGWYVGGTPGIGESLDIFDGPFPCTAFFGNCLTMPVPCANFYIIARGRECGSSFTAYRADAPSDFFAAMKLDDLFADDILPITAPALCDLTHYATSVAGLGGPFAGSNELWSNDPQNSRPMAPIPGTQCNWGSGCTFFPPITLPTAQVWCTYDLTEGVDAGPLLVGDFPAIGFGDDCFSIFGTPEPNIWSGCFWFFGGCPLEENGNPCGTFVMNVRCAGEEPRGACCDVVSHPDNPCQDDVRTTQCAGQFAVDTLCADAQFDPTCGTSACCMPDGSCENLGQTDCAVADGLWQVGEFCGVGNQFCTAECGLSPDCCGGIDPELCSPECCEIVCAIDGFYCRIKWDETCCDLAEAFCPGSGRQPYDFCIGAVEVPCNSSVFLDNTGATDQESDPGFSCHNAGAGQNGAGSAWAKFVAMAPTARLHTCGSESPADDSLLAVYTGSCAQPTEIGCSDDTDQCGPVGLNSSICLSGLIVGQTYYVQLAAWTDIDRGRYLLELGCPAPSSCGFRSFCPPTPVAFLSPPNGVVDARMPIDLSQPATIRVEAIPGAEPWCWSACDTFSSNIPIIDVSESYVITLEHGLRPRTVTELTYTDDNGHQTTGRFITHPTNVNADGWANPIDILKIIDCLNNVNLPQSCPWGLYSADINRSGTISPMDILVLIDLLNGTCEDCPPWVNTPLPMGGCLP